MYRDAGSQDEGSTGSEKQDIPPIQNNDPYGNNVILAPEIKVALVEENMGKKRNHFLKNRTKGNY